MQREPYVKALFLLIAALTSLLVALVAGFLSWASGSDPAGAFLHGGGAFILWMTLCVAILSALRLLE
ncbi:hypothetical protein EJ357_38565 [Streptomyces cyaneochromogenes]|uniref:Uncharacterized protein n=1 Tax=Streptomyces cyaneochromogenes TaxID=2496836 RepID=A0A3S9MHJ0_9ACTN|nr:hypothetical protein EJ357_38565 [Streptomyces cyaneochromogenes]